MNDWLDILKYILPSVVVFVATYYVLRIMLTNEQQRLLFELKKHTAKNITPIRLQAYERAILFLERINMENLIKRVNQPNMKPEDLQMALIAAIRNEYEHNLTQQIYMSQGAWDAVKQAKEETLKIVHLSMAAVKGSKKSMELIAAIFKYLEDNPPPPTQEAIKTLKKEVRHLF